MTEQEKLVEREPEVVTEETVTFADGERTNRSKLEVKEPEEAKEPEKTQEPDEKKAEKGNGEDLPQGVKRRLARLEKRQEDSQKLIDEYTYRMREAERKAEEAEKRMREAEESAAKVDPPKLEDFEDEAAWFEASMTWREKSKTKAVKEEPKPQTPDFVVQAQRKAAEIRDLGKEKYEDFDDLMTEDLPITAAMVDAIYEAEAPEDIAHYLGTHRKRAEKMSKMGPMAVAREILKIETELEAKEKPKPKVSAAPEPDTELTGGTAGAEYSIDKMISSQAEYEAARKDGRIR